MTSEDVFSKNLSIFIWNYQILCNFKFSVGKMSRDENILQFSNNDDDDSDSDSVVTPRHKSVAVIIELFVL